MALLAYGLLVNWSRGVALDRLMGICITVFFVVSHAIGWIVFGERPCTTAVFGAMFIVAGGIVIQAVAP